MSTINCPHAVSLPTFLACYSLPRHERKGPRAGIAGMAGGTRKHRAVSRAHHRCFSGCAPAGSIAARPIAASFGATGPRGTQGWGTGHRWTEPRRTLRPASQGAQTPAMAGSRTTLHGSAQCRTAQCRTARRRTAQRGATHRAVRRRAEPGLGDRQLPGGRHGGLRGHRLADRPVDRLRCNAFSCRPALRARPRAHTDHPPLWQVLTRLRGRPAAAHTVGGLTVLARGATPGTPAVLARGATPGTPAVLARGATPGTPAVLARGAAPESPPCWPGGRPRNPRRAGPGRPPATRDFSGGGR